MIGALQVLSLAKKVPPTVWLLIGLSIALGLATWRITYLEGAIEATELRLQIARSNLDQAVTTNEENVANVRTLQEDLRACVDGRAADIEAAGRSAREAIEERDRRMTELERELERRRAIYENDPDCDTWRLMPVCPAISDRVREHRAQGHREDGDR